LLTGRVPLYLDLGVFHLPIRAFYHRCLIQGQSFDWCPNLYGGMFLSGEGEHGPYHPLHLLLYRFLPLDRAFALEAYLHVPLLFAGLFLFLRRYVHATAALLGALCYTFCAGSICHNIYPNYQGVIAHLPWILLLLDGAAATSSAPIRRLSLCGVGLLTGSQLLLGAPQALSFSLFTEVLFVLFLAWHYRPHWTFWPCWLTANLLGLLIGSVQILATRELLANSTRDGFDPMMGSLLPAQLLQLLAPNLLSHHLPPYDCSEALYFGVVPLILALWWVSLAPRLDLAASRLARFALLLGILTAWLAMGKYGGLYLLQTCLPFVGRFRLPSRYFTLVALAGSILAAVAFDRLLTGQRSRWRQFVLPWSCVAFALGLAIFSRFAYPAENGSSVHRNYFAGPLYLGVAALALTAAAQGRRLGLLALIVLAVVDIEVFSLKAPFWPRESLWTNLPTLAEFEARAESPPCPHDGRWLESAFELPSPLLFNQPILEGYRGGLEPRKLLVYHTLAALRVSYTAWHHLSYWGSKESFPGLRRAGDTWYEVPDPLPRVRLVSHTEVSDAPAEIIGSINLATTALVGHPLALESGKQGTAVLVHEQPGELTVATSAPSRQLLVVADSFDPNWCARVDDKPATVERVNGDFLGCVVDRGQHVVHFSFRPACIRYGRLVSLAGLALTLAFAGFSSGQMLNGQLPQHSERFSASTFRTVEGYCS
jgi:hypothetical protein